MKYLRDLKIVRYFLRYLEDFYIFVSVELFFYLLSFSSYQMYSTVIAVGTETANCKIRQSGMT